MYRNYVELIGFLGSDAETKSTPTGKTVTNLSLATKESWQKDGEWESRTEWHKIAAWNGIGQAAAALKKGAHVRIEGQIRSREFDGQNGKVRTYEIVAFKIEDAPRETCSAPTDSTTTAAPAETAPAQIPPAEPPQPKSRKRSRKAPKPEVQP